MHFSRTFWPKIRLTPPTLGIIAPPPPSILGNPDPPLERVVESFAFHTWNYFGVCCAFFVILRCTKRKAQYFWQISVFQNPPNHTGRKGLFTPSESGKDQRISGKQKVSSYQAKVGAKAKKIKQFKKKKQSVSGKHQRKSSLSLSLGVNCLNPWPSSEPIHFSVFLIITARVRSTTGCYVFIGVCLLTRARSMSRSGRGGGYPSQV